MQLDSPTAAPLEEPRFVLVVAGGSAPLVWGGAAFVCLSVVCVVRCAGGGGGGGDCSCDNSREVKSQDRLHNETAWEAGGEYRSTLQSVVQAASMHLGRARRTATTVSG